MAVSLPTLDAIRIASPCNVSWESMTGDERARFCQHCRHQVFNLSAMSRDEAASLFLANRERICVRYYQRPDGTVMFSDCVSEARRRLWQRLALLVGLPEALLRLQGIAMRGGLPTIVPDDLRKRAWNTAR